MLEVIECPECRRKLSMRDELLGHEVKCPSCSATFVATALHRPPPPPPVAIERPAREPERRSDHDRRRDRDDRDLRPRRDPYDDDYQRKKPDRSAAVLTLGILGLAFSCIPVVGWVLGGIALGMGSNDLQEMERGRMTRGGEGATQGGKVCGLIAIILNTLALFVWCMAYSRDSFYWFDR
jgi:hypothetical protein